MYNFAIRNMNSGGYNNRKQETLSRQNRIDHVGSFSSNLFTNLLHVVVACRLLWWKFKKIQPITPDQWKATDT